MAVASSASPRGVRLRRPARITLWLACGFFLIAIGAAFAALVGTPDVSAILRVSAALGGLSSVVTMALALQQSRESKRERPNVLSPNLRRDDRMVDRADEMKELVEKIGESVVVNCHGQRGAGKSFMLSHLADVVNGHRSPAPSHPQPSEVSAALYFDLADAVGFEQVSEQVCRDCLAKPDGSWSDFVDFVTRAFAGRRVLLILDNANTPGLWPELGTAAYRYLASRPDDKLVLGSIDPVVLNNLTVERVPLFGLDLPAIRELVATTGADVGADMVSELHEQYDGLPFYVRLVTAYESESARSERTVLVDSVIDRQVIPELTADMGQMLSYASLMAVVSRQVSIADLEHCGLANLEDRIEVARRLSLLSRPPGEGRRLVKVHDLVRDAVLRVLTVEVSEAASRLFDRAYQQGRSVDAAFFLMFADPEKIGAERFDEVFSEVVRSAVKTRNYALLSNLHLRAKRSPEVMRFLAADQDRHDLFCFGCASELAALGRYTEAEAEIQESSIVLTREYAYDDRESDLQAELRFLQADVTHLLNRFDEAAQMFESLGAWAESAGRKSLRARCAWAHAHVIRHQGRDLDRALLLLEDSFQLADKAGDLFAKSQSVAGASGIKVVTDSVPDDEEARLDDIEAEIAASIAHDGYMLRMWKAQARLAWYRGRRDDAWKIIDAAIDKALALNDRALYNLYFERAEFLRLSGRADEALRDYLLALDFGEGNGDRNLVSNTLLGIALTDLTADRLLHHGSTAELRATVLRARQIALDADVNITVTIAEQIVTMLDGGPGTPSQFRLVVF